MAIKHGNVSISAVKHGSVTVSQVDHWNITVFASYAVTISAGTGVNSVFLSTNQNALSGSPSGTKFLKGTTVYAFAALNTDGYRAPSGWTYIGNGSNGNIHRVGSVTVNNAYSFGTINAETVSGPCIVKCSSNLIGLQSVYLSTSSTATFGSSSLNVTPGNEVYGFAVLDTDTYARQVSGWTFISGIELKQGAIYRVGSKRPTSAGTTTYYINLVSDAYDNSAVLFTRSGANVGSWTVKSHEMQVGEQFNWVTFSKSGSSIYCSYSGPGGEEVNNALLGTFNCPAGYTVNLTLTDRNGESVTWNYPDDPLNGPYVINAEITADSSQS